MRLLTLGLLPRTSAALRHPVRNVLAMFLLRILDREALIYAHLASISIM